MKIDTFALGGVNKKMMKLLIGKFALVGEERGM
jgi:hypothetical protein